MGYDLTNQEELIIKYLPLVERIAGRIGTRDREYEREDLINIGVIGLMDAIKRYDKNRKVPFEAYASLRIRGTIMDELRRNGKVSRDRIDKLNQYYSAKEDLENKLSRTPEESEIRDELGISEKELAKLHETLHYLSSTSLDTIIFAEKDSHIRLIDVIEDTETETPEEHFMRNERKRILAEAIEKLDYREKLILDLYYVEELTLREIAHILDISIPRVSQIHGRVLIKLREIMEPKLEVV